MEDPVVIENGCKYIRAGFGGEEVPRLAFRNVFGSVKQEFIGKENNAVGEEALSKKDVYDISYPFQSGIVVNFDEMEKIWDYTFKQLKILPEEHSLSFTELSATPRANRHKMAQITFETFNSPAFQILPQGYCIFINSGRSVGIAVEISEDVSHIFCLYYGSTFKHANIRLDITTRNITDYMFQLLGKKYSIPQSFRENISQIQEESSYFSMDYESDIRRKYLVEKKFTLPDGQKISLGKERFQCPELLFKPHLMGLSSPGIHEAIYNTGMSCDIDTRRDLFGNVLISGEYTLTSGFTERLEKEIKNIIHPNINTKIVSPPERKYSVWIGASNLSSISSRTLVTKEEYEECGPGIVDMKFLYF